MNFFIPILISLGFFLAKLIEMKYIDRDTKPLKYMIRDSLIVFLVSLVVVYIYMNHSKTIHDFMNVVTDNKTVPVLNTPEIFTDIPEF